jgi:hypothetical protein
MGKGVIYVGRGSRFGNPYSHDPQGRPYTRAEAVRLFDEEVTRNGAFWAPRKVTRTRVAEIKMLASFDLACWCPLDHPCHADVLLRIANGVTAKPRNGE